jgi:Recombinase
MVQDIVNSRRAAAALTAGILLLAALPAAAQVLIFPTDAQWVVNPAFSGEHGAGRNISGAVCNAVGGRGCIAVNDASNFVQAFSMSQTGHRIAAGTVIPLQPDQVGLVTFRFAMNVIPIIDSIRSAGAIGMGSIARQLNGRGVRTARGRRWHASSVRNLLARATS